MPAPWRLPSAPRRSTPMTVPPAPLLDVKAIERDVPLDFDMRGFDGRRRRRRMVVLLRHRAAAPLRRAVRAARGQLYAASLTDPGLKAARFIAACSVIASGRRPLRAVCFSKRFAPTFQVLPLRFRRDFPSSLATRGHCAETALARPGRWGANRALKGTALSGLAAAGGLERCDECQAFAFRFGQAGPHGALGREQREDASARRRMLPPR